MTQSANSKKLCAAGESEERPVRVLAYDEREGVFSVRFDRTGVEKRVKRLNLRFAAEDAAAYAARVAAARATRAEHERALRLRFYLDTNCTEDLVDAYDFEAKVHAVHSGCARAVHDAVFHALHAELVGDFQEDYRHAMRVAAFRYHQLNPVMVSTLRVLDLPEPVAAPPAPDCGVLPVVANGAQCALAFGDACAWAAATAALAAPAVHSVLQVRYLCVY